MCRVSIAKPDWPEALYPLEMPSSAFAIRHGTEDDGLAEPFDELGVTSLRLMSSPNRGHFTAGLHPDCFLRSAVPERVLEHE